MQPAEIERTTVEIGPVNGAGTATLRAVGSVDSLRRLHRRLYRAEGRRRGRRGKPPPAGDPRRRASWRREKINATQHTTEPPPRYSEASLIKKHGRARHRPALDLCRDAEDAARTATMSRIDKRRLVPQAKGRLVTAFLESFFERYVEYDFTADARGKARRDFRRQARLEGRAARFLEGFFRRCRRHQGTARHRRARRAERGTGAAGVPGARRWLRSAHLPEMRHRQAVAEARQVRRLRRLLELSRMQLHPSAWRRRSGPRRERPARRHEGARQGSGYTARRSRCAAAASAPMSSAATARRRQALQPAQGLDGRRHRPSRRRWRCCRCRAMSASIRKPAR